MKTLLRGLGIALALLLTAALGFVRFYAGGYEPRDEEWRPAGTGDETPFLRVIGDDALLWRVAFDSDASSSAHAASDSLNALLPRRAPVLWLPNVRENRARRYALVDALREFQVSFPAYSCNPCLAIVTDPEGAELLAAIDRRFVPAPRGLRRLIIVPDHATTNDARWRSLIEEDAVILMERRESPEEDRLLVETCWWRWPVPLIRDEDAIHPAQAGRKDEG